MGRAIGGSAEKTRVIAAAQGFRRDSAASISGRRTARAVRKRFVLPSIGPLRAFLGGFFSGEGSLRLAGTAVATINLRADDVDLLRTFNRSFDLGRVSVTR